MIDAYKTLYQIVQWQNVTICNLWAHATALNQAKQICLKDVGTLRHEKLVNLEQ